MPQELSAGQSTALSAMTVSLTVAGPIDLSVLVCNVDRKVGSDEDMLFFNNPKGPGVQVQGATVILDLALLRPGADRVVLVASPEDQVSTFGALPPITLSIATGTTRMSFVPSRLTLETCLILCEVYRHKGAWKVKALGQGYANGLAGVATDHGIAIEQEEPPSAQVDAPAQPAPQPTPQPAAQPDARSDSTAMAEAAQRIDHYAEACGQLHVAFDACLELANRATGARRMAEQRPQHEISIAHFEKLAGESEAQFAGAYQAFMHNRDSAYAAGASFQSTPDSVDLEMLLLMRLEDETYRRTSLAAHMLRIEFGPTSAGFLAALSVLNAAIGADTAGYGEIGYIPSVYVPAAPTATATPFEAPTRRSYSSSG